MATRRVESNRKEDDT